MNPPVTLSCRDVVNVNNVTLIQRRYNVQRGTNVTVHEVDIYIKSSNKKYRQHDKHKTSFDISRTSFQQNTFELYAPFKHPIPFGFI